MKTIIHYEDLGFSQVFKFAAKKVIVPDDRNLTESEVREQLLPYGIEYTGTSYYNTTFKLDEELLTFILLDTTRF